MKKFITVCIVAVLAFASAFNANANRFGVKAGINVADIQSEAALNTALGYQAGLAWQIDLPIGFSIQPELLYHVKASSFDQVESQLNFGYVELPVNIQWGFRFFDRKLRLFAQASPFIGYAVHMDSDTESVLGKYDGLLGNLGVDPGALETAAKVDKWTNINRFSYGCGLGVGLQWRVLQLTAQYVWNFGSLASDQKLSADLFNDKNFGGCVISLGILFGGKDKKKDNKKSTEPVDDIKK